MQSLLAFCAICLQLSSFGDLNNENVLRRDESCNRCLTDMLQFIKNKAPAEILKDGLYLKDLLLKEAPKLILEQQSTIQSGGCADDVNSKESSVADIPGLKEAITLLETFESRLEKLPSTKRQVREGFNAHRDSLKPIIQDKVDLAKAIWIQANRDRPNKNELPQHLKDLLPAIDKVRSEFFNTILPDQRDYKLSRFSSKFFDDLRNIKQKIQESKNSIGQTFNPQDFQEISLIYNQTVLSLEQYSQLYHQLDFKSILTDLDQRLKEITDQLEEYFKPSGRTSLKVGEKLAVNDSIFSESGVYSLILYQNWEIAIFKFSERIWRSGSLYASSELPQLILDPVDGVLKMQDIDATLSKSVSPDNPNYKGTGAYLIITNSGELRILESGRELWTPLFALPPLQKIESPEKYAQRTPLISENEIYTLLLTNECYFVLFEHSKPIWAKNLYQDHPLREYGCELQLKEGGYLGRSNLPKFEPWISPRKNSWYAGKASLIVRDDGVVAVMGEEGQELWTSKD